MSQPRGLTVLRLVAVRTLVVRLRNLSAKVALEFLFSYLELSKYHSTKTTEKIVGATRFCGLSDAAKVDQMLPKKVSINGLWYGFFDA